MTDSENFEPQGPAWQPARDRALAWLLERGSELEQTRARCLVGELPPSQVTQALVEGGALTCDAGDDPATLLPSLAMLDQVDQLDAPELEPVVATLARSIGEDGAWGDPTAPLAERITLSADVAGFLTKTLRLRPRVREAVEGFLSRTWNPDHVKTGEWAPIAAYTHFFSVNESELSDPILQWCGRELERGFRTRLFDAGAAARVFLQCHAVALPGASLSAAELCEALVNEQTEDGGFALSARALAGAPGEAVLDGLAALVRLGPAASSGSTA